MITEDIREMLKYNGVVIGEISKDVTTGQIDIPIRMLFNLNPRQKKIVEETFENEVWPKGYKTMKIKDRGFKAGTSTTISYLKTRS